MSGPEEWESVDDFSVSSLPAEESSFTTQSLYASSLLPEINEEIPNETDVTKNSSAEIFQKVGFVQYMKSDEMSRVKHVYSTSHIWMLGVEYRFNGNYFQEFVTSHTTHLMHTFFNASNAEDAEFVSLPKPDRGENARGGRASSLLNFMFGSEDNDTPSHDRYHSDDCIRTQKSHPSSQNVMETNNKGKTNIPSNGSNNVIQRLRTLSFSRRSSISDQQLPTVSQSTPNVSTGLLSPHSRLGGKRMRSFSFSKRAEVPGILISESKPSATQLEELRTNNDVRPPNMGRSLNTQHFLQNVESAPSSLNQDYESASHNEGLAPKPSKRTRRMTFTGFFSGKNKFGGSSSSQRLHPHLEKGELDQKHPVDDATAGYAILGDEAYSPVKRKGDINLEDIVYSSDDESEGNISIETITRESTTTQNDVSSNFEIIKDINNIEDISNDSQSQRTDIGSMRSSESFKLPVPTSLYKPDSLGPLTPNQETLMDFILDFQSRIYCCYRKEFPPIEPSFHTTDTGWGCMHRTGQSLLAQGFLWVLLGRDWRLHNTQMDSDRLIYRKILRWFMDGPMPEQYYSIHNIARVGTSLDKKIGDWFGPAIVAHALKKLSLVHKECPLVIYVPTDNTIYKNDIFGISDPENLFIDQRQWKPVLILLSVRLGTDRFNTNYSENLKKLFKLTQFLGIAGGRPGRSLYFVAVQDDELYYLDPHFVRPAINLNQLMEFPVEDYHSTIVRAMSVSEMDPSMLLGFLCQSPHDLDNLCERINHDMDAQFPILTIQNSNSARHSWIISKPNDIVEEIEDNDIEYLRGIFSREGIVKEEEYELKLQNANTPIRRESVASEENYEIL
ncbi:4408_t:CDS:10 [Acaulospora colombiana]|uniref:4408_t:CDS:1 n=1 Tax=Acaulospora colombiana TaxID=27376 RepID=A0ACA9L314_9GLOM|nr:4408_t:CDS:10 [Acaulospora colombiana]